MQEVNEVVQKVYGGEKPVPLWNEEEASTSALSRILFSLIIRIKVSLMANKLKKNAKSFSVFLLFIFHFVVCCKTLAFSGFIARVFIQNKLQ